MNFVWDSLRYFCVLLRFVCAGAHRLFSHLLPSLCLANWNRPVRPSHVHALKFSTASSGKKRRGENTFFFFSFWIGNLSGALPSPFFFSSSSFRLVYCVVSLWFGAPLLYFLILGTGVRMGCRWRWRAFTFRLRLPDRVQAKWKPPFAQPVIIHRHRRLWLLNPSTMSIINSSSSCPARPDATPATETTCPAVRPATTNSRPSNRTRAATGSFRTITTIRITITPTCTRNPSTICTWISRRSARSSPLRCL